MNYILWMAIFVGFACNVQSDKPPVEGLLLDTFDENFDEEQHGCLPGSYPALFSLWTSRQQDTEEEYAVDPPPQCEASFDIDIHNDGSIVSSGDCIIQMGSNSRTLSYSFIGEQISSTTYSGNVTLTKPNGEQHTDSFDGYCRLEEAVLSLQLTWFMVVTTPNGEREHRGKLINQ